MRVGACCLLMLSGLLAPLSDAQARGQPVPDLAVPDRAVPGPAVADTLDPEPREIVRALAESETRTGARGDILRHASGLPGQEATLWLQLAATSHALDDPELLRALGEALLTLEPPNILARPPSDPSLPALQREDPHEAESDPLQDLHQLMDARLETEWPSAGLAQALGLAARIVETSDPELALRWSRLIVDEAPEDMEAAAAALMIARRVLDRVEVGGFDAHMDELEFARDALEAFIVRRPADPLAPQARHLRARVLNRLDEG